LVSANLIILSVSMNALVLNISFGLKRFKQFRKHVPVDFKRGDKHAHRNPHAMPL
jgi:hypothetical protein